MQYHVLAVDYDGTLATHGHVDEPTVEALRRVKESGRRLILVTGRVLPSLMDAFAHIRLFDLVVAENGGVVFNPSTEELTLLATPPPHIFMNTLAERGVPPLETGHVIVATWTPHEEVVFETIRDLALELQVIFNKGAVMVLPTGINKASGLSLALEKLGFSPHNTVGVGDAENDYHLLRLCSVSAAVSNALENVKKYVDLVLTKDHSSGVRQLIDELLDNDLARFHFRPDRGALLGHDLDHREVRVPLKGHRVLVIGDPAAGKSRFATSVLEELMKEGYQTCIIDPEGDFQTLKSAIVLGTREQTPTVEEVIEVLTRPKESCVVCLFGTKAKQQPELFNHLLRALLDYRRKTGRPHWLLVDEAHYPLPVSWNHGNDINIDQLGGIMFITAFPDRLHRRVSQSANVLLAMSDDPAQMIRKYCDLIGCSPTALAPPGDSQRHQAVVWWRDKGPPFWIKRIEPQGEHLRHQRSYLDGQMDEDLRFHFRGPHNQLNLAVENLRMFIQIGEGVDDATWLYHLNRGDYANWFRDVIHDDELAAQASRLQRSDDTNAATSREQLAKFILQKYAPEV